MLVCRRIGLIMMTLSVGVGAAGCGSDDAGTAAPIDPYSQLFGNQTLTPAQQREQDLAVQQKTAECMKTLGWDYIPVDYSAIYNQPTEQLDYADPKFGEKYGYGIVKSYELYELPYLGDDGQYQQPETQTTDPNQSFIQSLSQDEQNRYYADLYGAATADTVAAAVDDSGDSLATEEVSGAAPADTSTAVTVAAQSSGCQNDAYSEIQGNSAANNVALQTRLGELMQQIDDNAALKDAEIDWSDCMYAADQNFDFLTFGEARTYAQTAFDAMKGLTTYQVELDPQTGNPVGADPNDYTYKGEQIVSTTQQEDGLSYVTVGQAKKLTQDQIDDGLAAELATWKVDQSCLEKAGATSIRNGLVQDVVAKIKAEFPDAFAGS